MESITTYRVWKVSIFLTVAHAIYRELVQRQQSAAIVILRYVLVTTALPHCSAYRRLAALKLASGGAGRVGSRNGWRSASEAGDTVSVLELFEFIRFCP